MKFGDKLYNLRRENGLSQEELGEKLNVTRQTVSKWELGQSKPDTDKLIEISKLLNVDFNQLINDSVIIENDLVNSSAQSDDLRPRKWLLVLLIIVAIIIVVILANKFVTTKKENLKNNNKGIFEIFDNDIFDYFEENDKKSFNYTLEIQLGTKSETSVSWLLDDIITNNKTNSDHIISVVFGDINTSEPNEIKNIKKKLGTTCDEYEVSADYDKDGYINIITIEEIIEEEIIEEEDNSVDSFDISRFNGKFELRAGTKYGSTVIWLLDDIITSNKTNSEHIIRVIYNTTNTVDENEIRNIKKSLDDWTEYEVIFDYDEIGYIKQVTITN